MADDKPITAEEKAAARAALAAATAPGKHSTKGWAPYHSGHCALDATEESHRRCTGQYGGVWCRCEKFDKHHGDIPKTEPRDMKESETE